MKTIKEIEKGCETCRNNYKFHKNRGDLNMWKLCLTCQSLLNYSNEIIEEIEKLKEDINNLENVEQRVITKSYAFLLINKFKQSIIGETG